jgi:hypothetical protein
VNKKKIMILTDRKMAQMTRQLSPGTANLPQLIPVTQLVFHSVGLRVTGFVLLS